MIVHVVIFLLTAISLVSCSENDLICFQCQGQSLEECRKLEYLKSCPNDQAYDRCETILEKKSPDANATVTKKCSLAPCVLHDDALGISNQCDMTKSVYSCSFCCKDNGCNAASDVKPIFWATAIAVILGVANSHWKLLWSPNLQDII